MLLAVFHLDVNIQLIYLHDNKIGRTHSIPLRLIFLFKSCGLWTLSNRDFAHHIIQINEILKWLTSLSVWMHNHSGGYSGAVGLVPPPPTSFDLSLYQYPSRDDPAQSNPKE